MARVEVEELKDDGLISPLENDPFQYQGGGAYVDIEGDKAFNASQLAAELEKRTSERKVSIALVRHDGKRRMWYHPANLDKRTVRGALKSHHMDENWGLDEEGLEVRGLLQRLKSGETLSIDDTTRVLRSIVQDQSDTGMTVEGPLS